MGPFRLRSTVGEWSGTGDCDDDGRANRWRGTAGLGGESRQEGAVCHATWRSAGWVGLGRSGERWIVVEAVGYLTCAESDMKQPSESLAGAKRRPVTTDQWPDRRWRAEVGVGCNCARRVLCSLFTQSTLGRCVDAGEAAAINKRDTRRKLPTSKTARGRTCKSSERSESAASALPWRPGWQQGRATSQGGAGQWQRRPRCVPHLQEWRARNNLAPSAPASQLFSRTLERRLSIGAVAAQISKCAHRSSPLRAESTAVVAAA